MLLEIDDADALLLFSSLPRAPASSQPEVAAFSRLRQRIGAEAQRRQLQWVVVDEDIEMGIPASPSPVSCELRKSATTSAELEIGSVPATSRVDFASALMTAPSAGAVNTSIARPTTPPLRTQTPPPPPSSQMVLSTPPQRARTPVPAGASTPRSATDTFTFSSPLRPFASPRGSPAPSTPFSGPSPSSRATRSLPRRALGDMLNTPPPPSKEDTLGLGKSSVRPRITPMRSLLPLDSATGWPGSSDVFGSQPVTDVVPNNLQPPIRLLSPLRLASQSLTSPSFLSPTSTLVGSVSPEKDQIVAGKIASMDAASGPTSDLTNNETSMDSRGKKRKVAQTEVVCSPRRSKRVAAAVAAGAAGDGDDDYDDEDRHEDARPRRRQARATSCPRGGSRKRVAEPGGVRAAAKTMGELQQQLDERLNGEENMEGGTAKEKWNIHGTPPTLSAATSAPIVWLSYLTTSPELQNQLTDLLLALPPLPPPSPSASPSTEATSAPAEAAPPQSCNFPLASPDIVPVTTQGLARRCRALEKAAVVNDYWQMMSYIDFALHVEWRRKSSGQALPNREIAAECGEPKITGRVVGKWYSIGSRLIYLASSSSMYLIPMLAAAGMKTDICTKYSCKQIQVLGFTLCNPGRPDGSNSLDSACGQLVRTVIIPQMALIRQLSSSLEQNAFRLTLPGPIPSSVPFSSLQEINQCLRGFNANYFPLPAPDSIWNVMSAPNILSPTLAPVMAPLQVDESCIGEEVKIVTPLRHQPSTCPVTQKNLESWTAAEREKASRAKEVNDLEALEEALKELHAGGEKTPDKYVCIDTKICEGKVLHLRGADGQLLAVVATNLVDTLPHLKETFLHQLASIMTGEIYSDKSKRAGFKYLAWHCSYYNRYAEKGHDAPRGIHPHYVFKETKGKVNHTQRVPHASKEIEDNPEEAEMLAELIHLITIVVEFHIRRFLPKEYEELIVYVSKLPLNERSLAYPFGGFVINICVSTRGHRDRFDKQFCVIIPIGDWTGGELCLYEAGFVFRLQPWDIIIFPSCDQTHFNLHFEGTRLSLVLHSDKFGDNWGRDGNGWLPNDDEYPTGEEVWDAGDLERIEGEVV